MEEELLEHSTVTVIMLKKGSRASRLGPLLFLIVLAFRNAMGAAICL